MQIGFLSLAKVDSESAKKRVSKSRDHVRGGKRHCPSNFWDPAVQIWPSLCQTWETWGSYCLADVKGEQTGERGDVLFYKIDESGCFVIWAPLLPKELWKLSHSTFLHLQKKKKTNSIYLPFYLRDVFWEITDRSPIMPLLNGVIKALARLKLTSFEKCFSVLLKITVTASPKFNLIIKV